jgi:hypothetical protein
MTPTKIKGETHIDTVKQPGFAPDRICALIEKAIAATGLDMSGLSVLTEAASGAYAATAIAAAKAGARQVNAVVRASRYGSITEVRHWVSCLADLSGVSDRVRIVEQLTPTIIAETDIIANSGHLRPINSYVIDRLPIHSVVALMFEAWEFRSTDIDLAACRRRQIPIVGINEHHPLIDVFSYLGPLCTKLLQDAGFPIYRNSIALVCDNSFAEPMALGLKGLGAIAATYSELSSVEPGNYDAVVVALQPAAKPRLTAVEADYLAASAPGTTVAQFWGDIDRDALARRGLRVWPASAPEPGHMSILLSDIGPDPIIRLQVGGLRAAEEVFRIGAGGPFSFAQFIDN